MDLCIGKHANWTAKQYYSVLVKEMEKSGIQNYKMCSALYETENTMKWRVASVKNHHEMQEKQRWMAYVLALIFGVSCPVAVVATGNIAKYSLNRIYGESMISIQESIEQPEYEDSLVEQYGDVLDGEDIIIEEITSTNSSANGSYTWEIDKESRNVIIDIFLKKGQTVTMGVSFSSESGVIDMGVIKGTEKRYVTLDANGMHNFEIKEDDTYKLYVKNKSDEKIMVDFMYFVL